MVARTLNFDLSDMSLKQLCALATSLNTVCEVLGGMQEQSRFSISGREPYNMAGVYIETVRVTIGYEVDAICEHAAQMIPADDCEAGNKFAILAASHSGEWESPAEVVRHLSGIAADIEWERRRGRARAVL